MRWATAGDVELAFETFGRPAGPPVLLIMGLAMQMLGWPQELCTDLARRGHHVIRYDNRDIGLSTHLDHLPAGDAAAVMRGDRSSVAYTIGDLALDAVRLMDALGLGRAHLVGASLGGAIAQTVALSHPHRVRSLTSIMASTGDRRVGTSTPRAMAAVLAPPARTREAAIARAVHIARVVGSTGFPFDEEAARDRAACAYDRGYDPAGVSRQLVALLTAPDRTARLRTLAVPSLVIHGDRDPLVSPDGGRATAAAIPGAELLLVEGMGHDLPRAVWPRLAERIAALVARAEAAPG
ncbi:Aclacinomycin methylesterase RdmC [Capillimicrobium parvum]|uniref:Aclacinomycin methylesterase RdmC n=1 Tax=Capillimicrobium parvum TaxID=2884022 RepID=A0A9E6XXR2_9ACTN|nr:Aclacinomycin methylesterase RdmC [Capillimicrobium parvum]